MFCSFITIRFYITLKQKCMKNSKKTGFITIRFYITLKRIILEITAVLCFITIRFYITLKLVYVYSRPPSQFYNYTILHYSQTSNPRIDTLQYQESLYPYYTTRQQSESITTLFATFNLSFLSKQSK